MEKTQLDSQEKQQQSGLHAAGVKQHSESAHGILSWCYRDVAPTRRRFQLFTVYLGRSTHFEELAARISRVHSSAVV
jgi:hypothetical protein